MDFNIYGKTLKAFYCDCNPPKMDNFDEQTKRGPNNSSFRNGFEK